MRRKRLIWLIEGMTAIGPKECPRALDEVAFPVERPVDGLASASGRVLLDLCGRAEVVGDEIAQMIGVVACLGDDVADPLQALDQPAGLRAVAPVPGRDQKPDRQPRGIDGGMDPGGQPAPGPPDGVSFKPPFRGVASACTFEMVASMSTYSKSGSSRNALKSLSHAPARDQRRKRVQTDFQCGFQRQVAPRCGAPRQPETGVDKQPVIRPLRPRSPFLPGTGGLPAAIAHRSAFACARSPPFSILNQNSAQQGIP